MPIYTNNWSIYSNSTNKWYTDSVVYGMWHTVVYECIYIITISHCASWFSLSSDSDRREQYWPLHTVGQTGAVRQTGAVWPPHAVRQTGYWQLHAVGQTGAVLTSPHSQTDGLLTSLRSRTDGSSTDLSRHSDRRGTDLSTQSDRREQWVEAGA
jgi:hypothetical protein